MDNRQVIYCEEVLRFRKVLNLTSVKDIRVFYETFISPSIMLGKWIEPNAVVLDIGSGMGVPGLPLLIDRDDIQGILVERRKKRTEFIRHVIRKMKLKATAYDADINDLDPLGATVCVARAVSDVSSLIKMCDKHMIDGGKAVLPVPDEAMLPQVEGWVLCEDYNPNDSQRVAIYTKLVGNDGGVSRET